MKKITMNLLSLFLVFCLLGTNIVSASYILENNMNDGIVSVSLNKNEELTNKVFLKNTNGYLTQNEIEKINLTINNKDKTIVISGDLSVTLLGEIETINISNQTGFVGVYDGVLEDGSFITLDITYTEKEAFVILSVGYLGETGFESAFFGIISNTTSLINSKKTDEFYDNENVIFETEVLNNIAQTYSTNGVDTEINHQGGVNFTALGSGLNVGKLNIYFPDEAKDGTPFEIDAKINTNCNNVKTHLKNNVYSVAQSINSAKADKFNMEIRSDTPKLYSWMQIYLPEKYENKATVELPIPIPFKSGTEYLTLNFDILFEKITTSVTQSTNGTKPDEISWEMIKTNGWSSSQFDGNENTNSGMGVQAAWIYAGSLTEEKRVPLIAEGKIRYIASITIDDETMTVHYTTPPRSITRHITVLPG